MKLLVNRAGIGIDIVSIQRFENLTYRKNISFYKKIFQISEINYCLRYKKPASHFAGKFAIKEAVKKSIPEKISMSDILTYHSNQKPKVVLQGRHSKKYSFIVSIAHEEKFAVGIVISIKII